MAFFQCLTEKQTFYIIKNVLNNQVKEEKFSLQYGEPQIDECNQDEFIHNTFNDYNPFIGTDFYAGNYTKEMFLFLQRSNNIFRNDEDDNNDDSSKIPQYLLQTTKK
jgi:hypothetical protein